MGQPITRVDLREEMNLLREEFGRHYATKADLAALETRLIKWMVGTQLGGVIALAAVATVVIAITRILGS